MAGTFAIATDVGIALQVSIAGMTHQVEEKFSPPPAQGEPLIFSSINAHFSVGIYLEQFFFHIFFPISIPIFLLKFGLMNAHAQSYDLSFMSIVFSWLTLVCLVLMILAKLLEPSLPTSQMVFPIFLYILHRLMVSFKYATLSEVEYRKFIMGGKTASTSSARRAAVETLKRYQKQLQLITGWLNVSDDMIRHEIEAAAVRHGISIESLYMIVPSEDATAAMESEDMHLQWLRRDQKHEWNKFLKSHSLVSCQTGNTVTCSGGQDHSPLRSGMVGGYRVYLVPLQNICEGLFTLAKAATPLKQINMLVFLNSIINVFINVYANRHLLHTSAWSWIYLVSSSYLLMAWYYPIAFFMVTVAADMYRQYQVSCLLDDMIRVTDINTNVAVNGSITIGQNAGHALLEGGEDVDHDGAVVGTGRSNTSDRQSKRKSRVYEFDRPLLSPHKEPTPAASTAAYPPFVEAGPLNPPEPHLRPPPAPDKDRGLQSTAVPAHTDAALPPNIPHHQHPAYDPQEPPHSVPPFLGSAAYKVFKSKSAFSGNDLLGRSDFRVPSIDLTYPQNLVNWCNCRIIMSNVGARFKLRISIYTGLCGFLVILLIIYILYLMLTMASDKRVHLILSSLFQLTVLWVAIFGFSEIVVLALAYQTNMAMVQHRGMVTQHVLRARRIITNHEQPITMFQPSTSSLAADGASGPHDDNVTGKGAATPNLTVIASIHLFLETANDVLQTLEVMEDMWPARVVGFKVGKEHVASAVSAMVLFLFTVINFCSFGSLAVIEN